MGMTAMYGKLLTAAAHAMFPGSKPVAIVTAAGVDAASSFDEVWQFALGYPNAELVRPLLLKVLPSNAIVVLPHDTFAMDLAPGLSVKLGAAYVPDVVGIEGVEGTTPMWPARSSTAPPTPSGSPPAGNSSS
jgi:electron transfer flavoprotein alpha subunit